MKTSALAGIALASVLSASPLWAADLPLKARPAPVDIAPTWSGFYVGGVVGGGWGSRDVTYTANDPGAALLVNAGFGLPAQQPLFPNSFNMRGAVGGIEAGYNWQLDRRWLVGVEADFSGSGIKGQGSTNSQLAATVPPLFQSVTEQQKIDWYGTVRARLGFLATDDLLLFATGGFAYGHVANSAVYATSGPAGLPFFGGFASGSFSCITGAACFTGASSATRTGWTAGAGAEWRFARAWSVKAEYQYVNLGSDAVTLTAMATVPAISTTPSSFNANFARDDFHVARVGVNFHF